MTAAPRSALALALATTLAFAGPRELLAQPLGTLAPPPPAPVAAPVAGVPAAPTPVERVDVSCPYPDPDAGVVLARVEREVITVCDVLIAWSRRAQLGQRVDDPRVIFRAVLREMLAGRVYLEQRALARQRELDPETARRVRHGRLRLPAQLDPDIEGVYAGAVLRRDALDALAREPSPTLPAEGDPRVVNPDEPERLRLRALVFNTRPEAESAIQSLVAGTAAWEELLPRSLGANSQRDFGDLGMLTRDAPPDGVDPAVLSAGYSLRADGDVHPTPVGVLIPGSASRRRRTPPRTAWWVVQRVEYVPSGRPLTAHALLEATRRRERERYRTLQAERREQWNASALPQVRSAIDPEALRSVRVSPPSASAPSR